MFGYAGKLLFVDLSSRTTEVRELDEQTAKDFIGGPALGAKILYDEMPAHTQALSPQNILGFVTGPANGTGALLGGRYTVVCKSPVTQGWNDSNSGGSFGPKLKSSGYDAVFIKGKSESPVYLFIDNGRVEFRDASKIWGRTCVEAENAIRDELGDKRIGVALIGPAGEQLSNMAAVMNDAHRAAGRGGSGAVMGSKNLKAVAVRGSFKPRLKDRELLLSLNKEVIEWEKNMPMLKMFSEYGTSGIYDSSVYSGDTGIRNWEGTAADLTEEQISALTGPEMDKLYRRKKYACHSCPVGCGAIYSVAGKKWTIEETGRPEYETLGTFGSMMLNADPEAVNVCNWLCNEYGYDTISMGATVTWLMACYCGGLFSKEELGGIDLTWGNGEAIVAMTERICKGEGIGKILRAGSLAAARHFNRGFEHLVIASGIELPMHDPRFNPGLARKYQYDPTPARHVKGGYPIPYGNQPPEVKYNYENSAEVDLAGIIDVELTNAGGFCKFGEEFALPPDMRARYLTAITGFDYNNQEETDRFGIRAFTIRHAFNLREGFRRKDFDVSRRALGDPPLKEGPTAGRTIDNERLADNLFRKLGWNLADAVPTKEALLKVGSLENVIRDLYPDT